MSFVNPNSAYESNVKAVALSERKTQLDRQNPMQWIPLNYQRSRAIDE
jgi:hypothetical protein